MLDKLQRFNRLPNGVCSPAESGLYVWFDAVEAMHTRFVKADKLLRDIVDGGEPVWRSSNSELRSKLAAYATQRQVPLMRFNSIPGGLINPEEDGRFVRFEDVETMYARLAIADGLLRDVVRDGPESWDTASVELRARLTANACQHRITPSIPDASPKKETTS